MNYKNMLLGQNHANPPQPLNKDTITEVNLALYAEKILNCTQ